MFSTEHLDELKQIFSRVRYKLIQLSHLAKTPHLGSSLSCADILVAVYFSALSIDPKIPRDANRDRFIWRIQP